MIRGMKLETLDGLLNNTYYSPNNTEVTRSQPDYDLKSLDSVEVVPNNHLKAYDIGNLHEWNITGGGDVTNENCGTYRASYGTTNGSLIHTWNSCYLQSCPVCGPEKWASRAGEIMGKNAYAATALHGGKLNHWIFSPKIPGISVNAMLDLMKEFLKRFAANKDSWGALYAIHPGRLMCKECSSKTEVTFGHRQCEECGGRDLVWIYSPHVHLLSNLQVFWDRPVSWYTFDKMPVLGEEKLFKRVRRNVEMSPNQWQEEFKCKMVNLNLRRGLPACSEEYAVNAAEYILSHAGYNKERRTLGIRYLGAFHPHKTRYEGIVTGDVVKDEKGQPYQKLKVYSEDVGDIEWKFDGVTRYPVSVETPVMVNNRISIWRDSKGQWIRELDDNGERIPLLKKVYSVVCYLRGEINETRRHIPDKTSLQSSFSESCPPESLLDEACREEMERELKELEDT